MVTTVGKVGDGSGILVAMAARQVLGKNASGILAPISLGANISMTGATINASGGGGGAADSFETVSSNLAADDADFFYSGDDLDHIDYASGITKTFAYGVDGLSTVTLSGSTPGGIALVKTLTYVSGKLDSITYT